MRSSSNGSAGICWSATRSEATLQALIERRAIAGLFLSARNVEGQSVDAIRQQIASLQETRRAQGLAPLWIATDQEGGAVSRMSPPLSRMPTLADIVTLHRDHAERLLAIRQYAARQGRELASLGVNLNFAPVVDLNHGIHNPEDRLTRIASRAISSDPAVVSEVADLYCETLKLTGVHCTLKHFPGLGRVFDDTHKVSADLATLVTRARSVRLASVPAIDVERCGIHHAEPCAPHRHRRRSAGLVLQCGGEGPAARRPGSTTASW